MAPSTASPSLRLTRRGRLVIVALVAALAFVLISVAQVAAHAGGASEASGGPVSTSWVVQPGETLWAIAERIDPSTDPRETVARIVEMNDLPTSSVVAGQELQIPA